MALDYTDVECLNTLQVGQVENFLKKIFEKINLKVLQEVNNSSDGKVHLLYFLQNQSHLAYFSEIEGAFCLDGFSRDEKVLKNTAFWRLIFCHSNV